jgi:hypothetical protein
MARVERCAAHAGPYTTALGERYPIAPGVRRSLR